MASKKDFSGINTGSRIADFTQGNAAEAFITQPQTGSRVFANIEQATSRKGQQGTASPQEAAERKEKMQTQGRKGVKAERINMAFSPSNIAFIRTMAKASGVSMTEFVNLVIAAYQREHPEFMEQAQAVLAAAENTVSILMGGSIDE